MQRDLIEALENDTGLPVKHVVVDLARRGPAVRRDARGRQPDRGGQGARDAAQGARRRRGRGASSSSSRRTAATGARSRPRASACATLLASLEEDGLVAAGMIGDPDPYTATMNAVQFFHVSEIVISTLPEGTSKWVADKLVERVADGDRQAGRAHRDLARAGGGGHLMEAAAVAARPPRARAPRAARGQPLVARGPVPARDAALHHLRGDGLRGLLHGLLLHPGRAGRRMAGARGRTCRS